MFARTLRTALLDRVNKDYVVAARSFGFHPAYVFVHWIFRNALIPYITIIGLQIRYILGGVVVIERIFGISGIGSLMVDGAFARDYPVVQACAVVFLVIVLSVNLWLMWSAACSIRRARGDGGTPAHALEQSHSAGRRYHRRLVSAGDLGWRRPDAVLGDRHGFPQSARPTGLGTPFRHRFIRPRRAHPRSSRRPRVAGDLGHWRGVGGGGRRPGGARSRLVWQLDRPSC